MKLSFWKADWFLGLLIALAFPFAARSDLLQNLERKAHPKILSIDPSLPPRTSAIIDKILQQLPQPRFHAGAESACALRACAAKGK